MQSEDFDALISALAEHKADPLSFVLWAFPWGEPGTELADADGPDTWQIEIMSRLRDNLISITEAIRLAIVSGHGIGKSAFVAWLILWAVSTKTDTRGVVTANTENQLRTKTWVELAKWHRLFIARDLFKMSATKLYSADPAHENTWRIDMVAWSERNTEAFAGLHNQGSRILLVFDEASAIPDIIWEVSEGALTDEGTEIIWLVCGNPTKNTGRFRECFEGGKFAHRWQTQQVDSRTVQRTNKKQIKQWVDDYGIDSDFVRIRVRGVFPRQGESEFISHDIVTGAVEREDIRSIDSLVMGIDVARFGSDATKFAFRRGRDARSIPPAHLQGLDTMEVVKEAVTYFNRYRPVTVFVDGGGIGAGVVDRLRELRVNVVEVQFGGKAENNNPEDGKYANKRAEIWGRMREWLKTGTLPKEEGLVEQFIGPTYTFDKHDAIVLESKLSMRSRGVASPDYPDALACTFAFPVLEDLAEIDTVIAAASVTEYDPYAEEYFQ